MCMGCNPGLIEVLRRVYSHRSIVLGAGLLALSANLEGLSERKVPDETRMSGTQGADTIFFGGPILTVVDSQPEVEALAIQGGRIIAVGRREHVFTFQTTHTQMIDLQRRTLMPGFVDPHLHLTLSALTRYRLVDVSPLTVKTKQEGLIRLKDAAQQKQAGEWIFAYGYDPSRLPPDHPSLTAVDLDQVSQTHPVFVLNQSGHIAYVNHKAFALVGITNETPDPPNATYIKDAHGELTGELHEGPAYAPFLVNLPPLSHEQKLDDCRMMAKEWARQGCTTVYDAGVGLFYGQEELQIFHTLANDSSTPLRFRAALVPDNNLPNVAGIKPGQGTDRLTFHGIKYWADGSTQGFTGAVNQPFLNQNGNGMLNYEEEDLRSKLQTWHDAGWQLVVHSNGDRATDQVLRIYEAILQQSPRPSHRHRIEHFTVTQERQLARAKQLGLSVSHTIGHVYYWGRTFRDYVLGEERARRIHPVASDFQHGLLASLHSDSPITPVFPLLSLQTVVTRILQDGGEVLGPEQRVTIDQALKTVTLHPAYQAFCDDKVGSLEVGKLADLVLLDRNPRAVDPTTLAQIKVLKTYLAGVKQSWD